LVTCVVSNDHICTEGYVPEFGARPLNRPIHTAIVVPIAQYILQKPHTKELSIDYINDTIIIKGI
jgi:ATP-dependent Clp protease ATP-binding subunit ClpA